MTRFNLILMSVILLLFITNFLSAADQAKVYSSQYHPF